MQVDHGFEFNERHDLVSRNAHLGGDNIVKTTSMGFIVFQLVTKEKVNNIGIKNILHVSKLYANLLMINKLVLRGLKANSTSMNVLLNQAMAKPLPLHHARKNCTK